jgi:hypothetical protein
MKRPVRPWLALAIAATLIAGHSVVLYYVSSHLAASTSVFAGVFILVVLKHVGLLGPFYAMLQKWRSRL